MDWQEKHEELIRLRQEAESWKEQCARVEENERALMKQSKELEAQLREKQEELEDLQALEAELKRFEQFLTAASSLVAHQLRLPSCGGTVLREKLSLRFAASLSRLFRLPGSFAPPFLTGNLRSRELEPGFHSPLLSAVAPISDRSDAGRSQRGRSTDESRLRSPPSPRFAEC